MTRTELPKLRRPEFKKKDIKKIYNHKESHKFQTIVKLFKQIKKEKRNYTKFLDKITLKLFAYILPKQHKFDTIIG